MPLTEARSKPSWRPRSSQVTKRAATLFSFGFLLKALSFVVVSSAASCLRFQPANLKRPRAPDARLDPAHLQDRTHGPDPVQAQPGRLPVRRRQRQPGLAHRLSTPTP